MASYEENSLRNTPVIRPPDDSGGLNIVPLNFSVTRALISQTCACHWCYLSPTGCRTKTDSESHTFRSPFPEFYNGQKFRTLASISGFETFEIEQRIKNLK